MAHRNAEIWAERHRRLERIKDAALATFSAAANAHPGMVGLSEPEFDALADRKHGWLVRYRLIERRVWHALCAAEGWRKA